jgi:hypothetical protein
VTAYGLQLGIFVSGESGDVAAMHKHVSWAFDAQVHFIEGTPDVQWSSANWCECLVLPCNAAA